MFELNIKVKDSEQTLNHKHLVYDENVQLTHDDPVLKKYVDESIKDFQGDKNDMEITLRIKYVW